MAQIAKKWLKNDAVGAGKIQLENNANLRGRNAANSADVNIVKVNASDQIEFASTPYVGGSQLATQTYVQSVLEGLLPKEAVRVVATGNITLSGAQTIDGYNVVAGDRVLVIAQTTSTDNGIYVAAAGAWSRSADMNASAEFPGAYTLVSNGTAGAGQGYVCSVPDSFILGTDPVTFVFFKAATDLVAGNGIDITGQTVSVGLSATPGLEFATGDLQVKVDAAGAITRGSNGIAVNLEASNPSLQISSNELGVKFDAAGALQKIAGGVSVKVDATTVKINGSNNLEGLKENVELITLSPTDISNQFIDLAHAIYGTSAAVNSAQMTAIEGPIQAKTVDYTVSLTGGAGGVTRITFINDLATGGVSALVNGDQLEVSYSYLT